jgi:hypothetical protein
MPVFTTTCTLLTPSLAPDAHEPFKNHRALVKHGQRLWAAVRDREVLLRDLKTNSGSTPEMRERRAIRANEIADEIIDLAFLLNPSPTFVFDSDALARREEIAIDTMLKRR